MYMYIYIYIGACEWMDVCMYGWMDLEEKVVLYRTVVSILLPGWKRGGE